MNFPRLPSRFELKEVIPSFSGDRFSDAEREASARSLEITSADNGEAWGYIVVDDTSRGPGLGGIRIARDVHLNEVNRLARAMTLKNSSACLPYGGGKAGIALDPDQLNQEPGLKRDMIGLLADALFEVPEYISAPDMGTNEVDIQQIHDHFSSLLGTSKHARGGAGRPPSKGGIPIDDWGLTAHSLYASIKTFEEFEKTSPSPTRRWSFKAMAMSVP